MNYVVMVLALASAALVLPTSAALNPPIGPNLDCNPLDPQGAGLHCVHQAVPQDSIDSGPEPCAAIDACEQVPTAEDILPLAPETGHDASEIYQEPASSPADHDLPAEESPPARNAEVPAAPRIPETPHLPHAPLLAVDVRVANPPASTAEALSPETPPEPAWMPVSGPIPAAEAAIPQTPAPSLGPVASLVIASFGALIYAVYAGFYSRLSRDAVRNHPQRRRILECLAAEPGLRRAELAARLSMHFTTVAHHLRLLIRWRLVIVRQTTMGTRYFVPTSTGLRAEAEALLRRPELAILMQAARRLGWFRGTDLARDVRIPKSTAAYRALGLVKAGVFQRAGDRLTLAPEVATLLDRMPSTSNPGPQPSSTVKSATFASSN